ncbi:hypothetical protein [Kingella potus]|uniref:hypothetical protein n=1 Tax=Kingella potus TaxID=265175 RepID=UPI001FD39B24|nr:hypothetical protein [Kingella potus]UOP01142.1 hypothetical protein LVJ84_02120 [Kingella potus]
MANILIFPVCAHADTAQAAANLAAQLPDAAVFDVGGYADEGVRLAAAGKADDWFDLLVGTAPPPSANKTSSYAASRPTTNTSF